MVCSRSLISMLGYNSGEGQKKDEYHWIRQWFTLRSGATMNRAATRVCRSNYDWCVFTVLLLLNSSWLPLRAQTVSPRKIELAADWKLASAEEARVGEEWRPKRAPDPE